MAITSDMSKAYNRVEWVYLKMLLQALGFNSQWVDSSVMCIISYILHAYQRSTVSKSTFFVQVIVFIRSGKIILERDLRQGNPVSFPFCLITKGLIHLLERSESEGRIQAINLMRMA